MSCNSCGCPILKNDPCISLNLDDLSSLLYSIDEHLCFLSEKIKNELQWGYKCKDGENEEFTKLSCYKNTLSRFVEKMVRGGKQCLSSEKIQCIIENVKDIVPKQSLSNRQDLIIDKSQESLWIAENPVCVSYEKWNKYSKQFCNDLQIELSIELDKCNFTLEVTKNIIPYEVLIAAEAYTEACDLNLSITRDKHECKLDWRLLLEKVPDCNLNLKAYTELVDCNLSFDIIKEVYSCGLELKVDLSENKKCILKTKLGAYKLCEIGVHDGMISTKNPTKTVKYFLEEYKRK